MATIYNYAVIDAPGYCDNRTKVWSRHKTLSAARKALARHWVNIPGNGRKMSCCIVECEISASTDYKFWDGIRAARYPIHSIQATR